MAAIQNIKILHKRYSSAQWLNGITVNGETIIPKLAQGEIGLATDTLEVRIGTLAGAEQTFEQAKPIGTDLEVKYFAKENGSWKEVSAQPAGTVVVDVKESSNNTDHDTIHEIHVYYDKISMGTISDFPDFAVNPSNSVTAAEGEIKVITDAQEVNEHELQVTYGTAATKSYVDTKFSTAKYIDVVDDTTLEEDDVSTISEGEELAITYVANVKESSADHTIELDKRKLIIPSVTIDDAQTGDYVSDITIDANDSHKIKVSRANLPSLTTGSGSGTGNGATLVGGISVNGHEITASKKTIEGVGDAVTVTGTNDKITITVDTYTKAQIDEAHNELAKAMKFKGTLDSAGTNGITALPSNAKQGDVYKVARAGVYGGSTAHIGDLFIYDGSNWRYIPSGDESFTDTWRAISVNGEQILSNDIGTGSLNFAGKNGVKLEYDALDNKIEFSHIDTSSVEDLTEKPRTYVDGLTFDEYGHVTGYTVAEETVVDTNTAHTHSAGAKLVKTGNGGIDGNVEYAHDTISTTTSADTSKNKTITAGGTDNTFTVVDSLVDDGYGHITGVKTKEVTVNVPQDQNTLYSLTGSAITDGAQVTLTPSDANDTASNVQFAGEDGTTVTFKNGKIVISSHDTTYELATKDLAGLVKVANVLSEAASANVSSLKNYTGSNNDKLYGVNRKADGTTFVEVPWHDTTYSAGNGISQAGTVFSHAATTDSANKSVDMYAFGTDAYGHAQGLVAITTIDGNYA